MNETIINLIEKDLKKNNIQYYSGTLPKMYVLLMYLKYLCDSKIDSFSYEEIINTTDFGKIVEKMEQRIGIKTYIVDLMKKSSLNKILGFIEHENLEHLIKEFILSKRSTTSLYPIFSMENDNILYMWTNDDFHNYDFENKNVTYFQELKTSVKY